jgi:tetratricopeptide (TPR) repeat protein
MHAAVLEVGERFYAGRADEKAEWLAFHAFEGEEWSRAVGHLQRAAARAIARAAHRVAAQHLEKALAVVDRLPPSPDRTRLAFDLRIDMRHAITPLGLVQRTVEHLRAAEALAIELDDAARLGKVVSFIANCLVLQGRYKEALVTGQRALNIARELDNRPLEIASQMYIARVRVSRGEYRLAVDGYKEVIRSLDERPIDDFAGIPVRPAAFVRSSLASVLAELGAFAEADTHALEATRHAEASGQPDSVLFAYWGTGLVALTRGDANEAVRVFDRLLALCRAHDFDAYVSRSMAGLGLAKARAGQVTEGLALLEQAVALDTSAEPRLTHTVALTALAEASFRAGDLKKAMSAAMEALRHARTREERVVEAYATWLLAMIRAAGEGDPEAVEGDFRTAEALAGELGLRPLLAHCWLGLGDLNDRRDNRTEAATLRERGRHLLETLGARPWIACSQTRATD